jgi:hypothetical protein
MCNGVFNTEEVATHDLAGAYLGRLGVPVRNLPGKFACGGYDVHRCSPQCGVLSIDTV